MTIAGAPPLTQTDLLRELEPVVEENLERHMRTAKDWMPHEYVPWSEGRDFDGPLGGEAWAAEQSPISEVARTSLVVNLLTEDNLPSYHHEIATVFGRDGAWGTWVHRWTAEEGRHGIAIRDYLLVTRSVDPVALERARMTHMGAGFESANHDDLLRSLAYVSFQELATRISHRNTGKITKDPVADQLLARIALDENLHMLFYRNLLGAALEVAPNQTMRAITEVVKSFEMPGSSIEDFTRKSVQIALSGIYDLRIHHDDVLVAGAARSGASSTSRASTPRARRPATSSTPSSTELDTGGRPLRGQAQQPPRRSSARAGSRARGRLTPSRRSTAQPAPGEAHHQPAAVDPHVEGVHRRGGRSAADRAVLEAEDAAVPRAGHAARLGVDGRPRAAARPGASTGRTARRSGRRDARRAAGPRVAPSPRIRSRPSPSGPRSSTAHRSCQPGGTRCGTSSAWLAPTACR